MNTQHTIDPADSFRYVESAEITTSGGTATLTFAIDPYYSMYVRRYHVAAYYLGTSPATARAVVEDDSVRDILMIDIVRGGGDKLTQNPIDIHSFNRECDDHNYEGWIIPAGAKLAVQFSHHIIAAANWGVPIQVWMTLSGYRLRGVK